MTSDFETFLKLLTTQLRNQDPLKPLESTEFVSQLASFSAVEQQVKTNETLEEMLGQLGGGSSLAGLAEWIGKEVRTSGPLAFRGEAIAGDVVPVSGADNALTEVRNEAGDVVFTAPISVSARVTSWDGALSGGGTAPAGNYTLSVSYRKGSVELGRSVASSFATVSEVVLGADGAPVLVTESGARLTIADITGVRGAKAEKAYSGY
jgi:flagellar basal-body rod modification protein FlgD